MSYNIVLFDTDAQHANQIKEHLKGYSEYKIHVFTNQQVLFEQLKSLNPTVIFMDAELHHDTATMNAETQVLFQLKEMAPDAEVILFSGEEKIEFMLDQVKKGIHGFALKSVHTKAKAEMLLLSAIRSYKQKKDVKLYKRMVIGAVLFLALMILYAILAYKFQWIKDDIQGGSYDS